jgi:hypothetical protein
MDFLFTIFGVLGSVCCVGAYFLLEQGKLSAEKPTYYILNGLGASLVLIGALYSFDGGDLGAVIQELCWVAISAMGLFKILKVKQNVGN